MKSEFTIGKAVRPRGLKGELKFELYTSDASRFSKIKHAKLDGTLYDVEKVIAEGDFAYVKFVGIDSVEQAEKFRGKSLTVDRSELPKPKDGTYYIADVIGSDVVCDGDVIGELVDVLQYGSADVYVVKQANGGLVQFPALKDVIRSTDVEKGVITLDGYYFRRVAVYDGE